MVYLQEYLAQFTDGGGLFRKVLERAIAEEQPAPEPGHSYVFGLDWGRKDDYTVISVVDTTLHDQVYLDRFSGIDYELQKGRLWSLYDRFRPGVILAEENNMGGPLVENLRSQGLPIQPFVTTNATKKEIIDGLALALEQGSFHILNDAVQVGELLAFEQTRLPSGLFRYAAAGNGHDDTVIALALSRYAADRPAATDLIAYL
jgi:phage FluMu gp28-like protein